MENIKELRQKLKSILHDCRNTQLKILKISNKMKTEFTNEDKFLKIINNTPIDIKQIKKDTAIKFC